MGWLQTRIGAAVAVVLLVAATACVPEPPPPTPEGVPEASAAAMELLRAGQSETPIVHSDDGLVTLVSGEYVPPAGTVGPVAAARWFIDTHREVLGVSPASVFPVRVAEDPAGGVSVDFQQLQGDVPVYRSAIRVGVSEENTVVSYQGPQVSELELDPQVSAGALVTLVDAAEARLIAQGAAGPGAHVPDDPELVWFVPELVGEQGAAVPAWRVTVRPKPFADPADVVEVVVSADDASVLRVLTGTAHSRPGENFRLYDDDEGIGWTGCGSSAGGDWDLFMDEDGATTPATAPFQVLLASQFLHQTYHWFYDEFGRRSWDNSSDRIPVVTRHGTTANAVYSGPCDAIGFATGWITDDIMAHEFTHGVDRHTASLDYQFESGAANEAFADIMGAFVTDDWILGEPLGNCGTRNALRDMVDPTNCGDPDRYSNRIIVPLANDSGGVHTNSSILNKAAYLVTDGDVHPSTGVVVEGIGDEKAAALFHGTHISRVGGSDTLSDVRDALVGYARFLESKGFYDFTDDDVCQVIRALEAVELGPGDNDCDGLDDDSDDDDNNDGQPDASDPDDDDDTVPDGADNCPLVSNLWQEDADGDGLGNACDPDADGDGIVNPSDNCPSVANPQQQDRDSDGLGDHCEDADFDGLTDAEELQIGSDPDDRDTDGDGLWDEREVEYLGTDPTRADTDSDGLTDPEELDLGSDPVDSDTDGDGHIDGSDNCVLTSNADQADGDGDGVGDACDNCPSLPDTNQSDLDADGLGDPCDDDDDGDGSLDGQDNCPTLANPDQVDLDGNGSGLLCDEDEAFILSGDFAVEVSELRFDPLTRRSRIPFQPCLVTECDLWLQDDPRVEIELFSDSPVFAQISDNFGNVFGDALLGGGGSEMIDFEPAPDLFYPVPGGPDVERRQYYIEVQAQPLAPGEDPQAPIALQVDTELTTGDDPPPDPATALDVATGGAHTCAVLDDSTVRCWGNNSFGQLGNPGGDSASPVAVVGLFGAAAVTAGPNHSCASLLDGTVRCWGQNGNGQLGDGTQTDSSAPVVVAGLDEVVQLSAGAQHTCALRSDGSVWCWGSNSNGQLGIDPAQVRSTVPVEVAGVVADDVGIGGFHSCASLGGGAVCWGDNSQGQFGDGTNVSSHLPQPVGVTTPPAEAIEGGATHTCARLFGGYLQCFGAGTLGQLGDGSSTSANTPVNVSGVFTATAVSAGGAHSCALLADATVRCWGNNASGALGDGTNTNASSPVAVAGLPAAVLLDTGGDHSCAIVGAGSVSCWGSNAMGQLGDGTLADSNLPVVVGGL